MKPIHLLSLEQNLVKPGESAAVDLQTCHKPQNPKTPIFNCVKCVYLNSVGVCSVDLDWKWCISLELTLAWIQSKVSLIASEKLESCQLSTASECDSDISRPSQIHPNYFTLTCGAPSNYFIHLLTSHCKDGVWGFGVYSNMMQSEVTVDGSRKSGPWLLGK